MKTILLSATRNKPGNACISHNYIRAALAAGLPLVAAGSNPQHAGQYAALADGLILTGGDDIDPAYFGQQQHPEAKLVAAEQDEFDMALFMAFFEAKKPVLGICRGIQVINVALGGDLVQHIPDAYSGVEHRYMDGDSLHAIRPLCNSWLGIAEDATVNSAHHQAVGRLGQGLRAVAASADGVIEAVQHEGGRVLGVQWHPERLDSPLSRHVFEYFASIIA